MSINLTGLSPRELGALIRTAKQQAVVAKRGRSPRSAPS
jgi:hypothetical protein